MSQKRFEEYHRELEKNCNFISSNLTSLGIKAQRLDTQSLIELYYNSYNPDLFLSQPLEDLNKLNVEV